MTWKSQGKIAFCHAAARELNQLEEEVERRTYQEAVAARYGFTAAEIEQVRKTEAARAAGRRPAVVRRQTGSVSDKRAGDRTQRTLLAWMADDQRVITAVQGLIAPEDFSGELEQTICRVLYDQSASGSVDPAALIDHFEDKEKQEEAAIILHTDLHDIRESEDPGKALTEMVYQVIIERLNMTGREEEGSPMSLQEIVERKKTAEKIRTVGITL